MYVNNGRGAAFQAGDQVVFADLDGDGLNNHISIGTDSSLLAYRNGGANSGPNNGWNWINWGTIVSSMGKRHQVRYLPILLNHALYPCLDGDGKVDFIILDDKVRAFVY
jgi:hypothetical protein